jgi:hypothetical protein
MTRQVSTKLYHTADACAKVAGSYFVNYFWDRTLEAVSKPLLNKMTTPPATVNRGVQKVQAIPVAQNGTTEIA